MIRITQEEFLKKAKEIHEEYYDYSKAIYKNSITLLEIICPKHGSFLQKGGGHLMGYGCPKCGYDRTHSANKYTLENFITKAKEVHKNKYDYSKVKYEHNLKKIEIICPKHGSFYQTPVRHISKKRGCYFCAREKGVVTKTKTTDQFIRESKAIFGDTYIYLKTKYIQNKVNLIITCKKHGDFSINPMNHLRKEQGCPECFKERVESKACRVITNWLKDNNVKYEKEKRFETCKNKKCLPFDFYLPEKIY